MQTCMNVVKVTRATGFGAMEQGCRGRGFISLMTQGKEKVPEDVAIQRQYHGWQVSNGLKNPPWHTLAHLVLARNPGHGT